MALSENCGATKTRFASFFRCGQKVLFVFCFWIATFSAAAQIAPTSRPKSTYTPKPYVPPRDPYIVALETAQGQQRNNDYAGAYKTLRQYIVPRKDGKIPGEMLWYAAQMAYLNHEPDVATDYYERALSAMPQNHSLMDDYGSFLLNERRYKKAIAVLSAHPDSTLTRFYLAKVYYWQGDYVKAKQVFNAFSPEEKSYDYIKALRQEFDYAKGVRIDADFSIHTDDQPLQSTAQNVWVSKKWNNLFAPTVGAGFRQFQTDSGSNSANVFYVGNRFHINPIKTDITAQVGSIGLANSSAALFGLRLYTQVGKSLSLEAGISKEPYLFTVASTINVLTYTDATAALNLNSRWLLSRFQYTNQNFGDNQIKNSSFWLLVPVVYRKAFKIRIGYAYQYSNADSSRYVPKYGNVGQNVEGMYRPYFTPINQQVNSALVQIQAQPSSRLNATLSVSFPLSAQIDNPYLNTTSDTLGNITLARGFLTTKYSPVEVKASLGYKISRAVDLAASYQYANLFFYQGHTVGLSTRILLK